MRRAAERVDDQMRAYMRTRSIPGPWAARERLLVCVTSHPISERLVRAARRLADELNAPWTVLHVEVPDDVRLRPEQREQLARTLRLAEELGAKTVQRPGESAAEIDSGLCAAAQHYQDRYRQTAAPALDRMAARFGGRSTDAPQRPDRCVRDQRRSR